MPEMADQKTDNQLWQMLDQPALWLIYGGGVLAEETTLRRALLAAKNLMAGGSSISELVMTPGMGVTVPLPQIRRLLEQPEFGAAPRPSGARGRSRPERVTKRKNAKSRASKRKPAKSKAKPSRRTSSKPRKSSGPKRRSRTRR